LQSESEKVSKADLDLHISAIRAVILMFRVGNMYLKAQKSSFATRRIDCLGFIVSFNGLEMNPSKVEAVTNWDIPKSVKGIQRFLGLY
jgi:hypothetical protein